MDTKTTSSLSPHRQRKHDLMVQKILETARAIMREQGVAALSMQELARRMDMRAPSLYHYFSSKMDVYDALFRYGFKLYEEYMEQNLKEAQSWQDFVAGNFQAYFQFGKQNPELFQLCFERPVPGFVPSEENLQFSFGLLDQGYEWAESVKDTIHTHLPARQMVDLLISMMHGITAMHLANEPDLPPGLGRFGSLLPAALELLDQAWSQPSTP